MIKNLAGQSIAAGMVDATTGAAFVGTVTVYITGDNGVQTLGTINLGVCTAEGNGLYSYDPAQAETNYDFIEFTFIGTGAIPVSVPVYTVSVTSGNGITLKASRLITNALKRIGVIAGTETPSPDQAQDGLDRLNAMIDSWAIQRGTIQGQQRFEYPLVNGQGGPSNPYVIGIGNDFNQARPVWIVDAGISWSSGTSYTEIPVNIVPSPSLYSLIVTKNTTSTIPITLYYEGISTGKIFLWPVPSSASYNLVLYVPVAVTQFADYNKTSYTLPTGYQLAIETNLAIQLLPDYPRDGYAVDPLLMKIAADSLAYVKRMNLDLGLLECDPALQSRGSGYAPGQANWYTGP